MRVEMDSTLKVLTSRTPSGLVKMGSESPVPPVNNSQSVPGAHFIHTGEDPDLTSEGDSVIEKVPDHRRRGPPVFR